MLYYYNNNDEFTQEEKNAIGRAFNMISAQTCVKFLPQENNLLQNRSTYILIVRIRR